MLASIASQNNKDNITAITVLFDDFKNSNLDETLNAKKITQKLGLKHFIFKVTEEDFTRDYPKILNAMDQPSIDGINVWYASKAAAKLNLKVVFSGLGGDEIFFGYDHFNKIPLFHKYLSYLRNIVFFKFILKFFFKFLSFLKSDEKWKNLVEESKSIFSLWYLKRTIFTLDYINKKNFLNKKINISNFNLKLNEIEKLYKYNNPKIILSYLDSIFYMRNQLLRDSDWASMYHGVELRTPFVDSHLLKKLSSIMISYSSQK